MTQPKFNIQIKEGNVFFAHEMSANFTPTQVSLDFKCITPRTDPRGKQASFLLEHNLVLLEPWHAKMALNVLTNVVKKYEEEFGKIKKPKSLEKAEKKHKKQVESHDTNVIKTPNYFG
ncbi:DUF3467 domain-containing protein [Candidatus Woesearchaeota archaeon]|nr:DUF3467 domain-containing protein [Candidatus Woesearchaeota archaeon]